MHFSIPIILGASLLSSLGAAISLPPKGQEWVNEVQSYMNDHEGELQPSQIEALNNALVLAVTRDEKLAPEMKAKMVETFGKEETVNLLTSRSSAAECECHTGIEYSCRLDETCVYGGCTKPSDSFCGPTATKPCNGHCV